MTPEQFCYWLQGFAELNQAAPTAEQWKSIQEHVATVFVKVTPPVAAKQSSEFGGALQEAAERSKSDDARKITKYPWPKYPDYYLNPGVGY